MRQVMHAGSRTRHLAAAFWSMLPWLGKFTLRLCCHLQFYRVCHGFHDVQCVFTEIPELNHTLQTDRFGLVVVEPASMNITVVRPCITQQLLYFF